MELSARTIQDHRFSTSTRGYRKRDVEDFLERTAAYVSHLEEELAIARTRAEKASLDCKRLEDRIDVELDHARQARATILEEAKAQAAAIVAAAERAGGDAVKSAAIIKEAETTAHLKLAEVDSIIEHARARADGIVGDAEHSAALREAEADRVLEVARRDAKRVRQEAERRHAQIESTLAEINRILEARQGGPAPRVTLDDHDELVVDLRVDDTQNASAESRI